MALSMLTSMVWAAQGAAEDGSPRRLSKTQYQPISSLQQLKRQGNFMQTKLDDAMRRSYIFLSPFFGPLTPAQRLELHQKLVPFAEDYQRVFATQAVAAAQAAYAPFWSAGQPFLTGAENAVLNVYAAFSEDFQERNSRAEAFPGGYAQLAGTLIPSVIWVGFRVTSPGERNGTNFDGLVLIDDRFVMFPKPFRFVKTAGME